MTSIETKEITNGIFAVQSGGFVNMYIIKGSDSYIAIDAGSSPADIEKGLAVLNILPDKVTAVFLTHTDLDHTASIKLFKNARVYISSAEEQMINGKTARSKGFHNSLDSTYTTIYDNDVLTVSGLTIKGILTPGHTPGSMTYLINGCCLFTGDLLSLNNQRVSLFNEVYNMDPVLEGESIKKLAALTGIEYMFTAHYGYTDDFEGALTDWK